MKLSRKLRRRTPWATAMKVEVGVLLAAGAVIRNFRIVASDGKSYDTQHYNLDVIIAVGHRNEGRGRGVAGGGGLRHLPSTETMNLEACVSALARCTFLPGGWDKRFVRNIPADLNAMTEKQRWWLVSLTHRYRRQIPDKLLIQQASEWLANNPKP